jgi:ArsR family transcriptional regulator
MRKLAETFKALAEETRLRILALLVAEGELCVCDCEHALGITQSRASRHLRTLQRAGLVEDRREAIWVFYRIDTEAAREAAAVLTAIRPLLVDLDVSAERTRLAEWRRTAAGARCAAVDGTAE